MGATTTIAVHDRHDAALYAWRDAGVRDRTLVHIDAHPDAHPTPPDVVEIGNFIRRALQEGIVREVFWIVPDPSWQSRRVRRDLVSVVRELHAEEGRSAPVRAGGDRIETAIGGCPFTVTTLSALRGTAREVLLDIDVDYCLIADVTAGRAPARNPWPWIWPSALVQAWHDRRLDAALTTIATSVAGDYTPLKWKYFGEELSARLSADGRRVRACERLEAGIRLRRDGNLPGAEAAFRDAVAIAPEIAGGWYWLAQAILDRGGASDAPAAYAQALDIDPEYRTPYSEGRALQLRARDRSAARVAYQRILALDPADPYAHFGLGTLSLAERRSAEAIVHLERAVELAPDVINAHRALGEALERCGRTADAIHRYEHSLLVGMHGGRWIGAPVTTRPIGIYDPQHPDIYARIARLQTRVGVGDPVASCRIALAAVPDRLDTHALLTWHYVRRRRWRKAATQAAAAIANVPRAMAYALILFRRWLRSVMAPA